jgi:hypothetical protein
MNLFDPLQAQHFCKIAATPKPVPAGISQSLRALHESLLARTPRLAEGSNNFELHRVNLLQSVERWMTFALSNYRRSLDMLVPIAAPWAHVSLYYSAFFSAHAILGMFGGWVDSSFRGNRAVDVETGTTGSQVLRVHRKLPSPHGAQGSHRAFWDFFYDASAQLIPWVSPEFKGALLPVNGDYGWQIAARNGVNYDMHEAWEATKHFYTNFMPRRFPDTLTGDLGLQFDATQQLLRLAAWFADDVGLAMSGLADCGEEGSRRQIQRKLVQKGAPRIVNQSSWVSIIS